MASRDARRTPFSSIHRRLPAPLGMALFLSLVFLVAVVVSSAAQPTEKWRQDPDLTTNGIDVNDSFEWILADDFQCTETGLITHVRVWGSWLNDRLPSDGPLAVDFTLSIHADIPANESGTGYSMPGHVLWTMQFASGSFDATVDVAGITEGWLDPPDAYSFPADNVCWVYDFPIPSGQRFLQTGLPDQPTTYWLDVKAVPREANVLFGWKTSGSHWNDDAVWGTGEEPYAGPWTDLHYPPGHQLEGRSIDLAFLLMGQPVEVDYGDAPQDPTFPGYQTTLANDGARHAIDPTVYLGFGVDGDLDGQPDPQAMGDDNDGNDDEDAIVSTTLLYPGMPSAITFRTSTIGFIRGWIDFDQSGDWTGVGELFMSGTTAPGQQTRYFNVPETAVPGQTYGRVRFTTAGPTEPYGPAPDGEVEDYLVEIQPPLEAKWLQPPNLRETALDVDASGGYLLADDFLCTESGRITEISLWTSWLNDYVPFGEDPRAMDVVVSIHADIPADQTKTGYSMPGETLWWRVYPAASFQAEVWAENLREGWMTPPDQYIWPGDYTCWRYTFEVPVDEAFHQTGTPDEPTVYWLDFQAFPHDQEARIGWKVSTDHWNDDATWAEGDEPYNGAWRELVNPPDHPYPGESLDLAFLLNGVPDPEMDFGDAPDFAGAVSYPTLYASNGARHVIVPGVYLGAGVDSELDGQPSGDALGDDNDIYYPPANDDEDGVVFTSAFRAGARATWAVTMSVAGHLDMWFDLNGNGSWADPGEQILNNWVTAGTNTFSWYVPASATPGPTMMRFRFNTGGSLSYDGPAEDGEVEDYQVVIEPPAQFKWEQPPDSTPEGVDVRDSYDLILADDFPCTQHGPITEIHVWGSWWQDYLPFQFDPGSVDFVLSIHADIPAAQSPTGFSIPGETLWWRAFGPEEFTAEPVFSGIEGWMDPPDVYAYPADSTCWEYVFNVPTDEAFYQRGAEDAPRTYWLDVKATPRDANAVFGWKTSIDHWNDDAVWGTGAEPYPGPWQELIYPLHHPYAGHSMDLAFAVYGTIEPPEYDFGDAEELALIPGYPTTLSRDGARHVIVPGVYMGAGVDAEPDGQPSADALGDDNDGNDDEDGVIFTAAFHPGSHAAWSATFSVAGHVDIWMDWNRNHSWADPGEHIGDDPVTAGTNTFSWYVPVSAVQGQTMMRFRFNTGGSLSYVGAAADGEVEDYLVEILEPVGVPGRETPREFMLYRNAPNPFGASTTIRFDLPEARTVRLDVFSVDGRRVATLVDESLPAGRHEAIWDGHATDGKTVANGIYYYRLEAGSFVRTMRMVLLR